MHLGAEVSIFNPMDDSPFQMEFRVNESDVDTTFLVYVRLNPGDNATVTLERDVNILLSTISGTAGEY